MKNLISAILLVIAFQMAMAQQNNNFEIAKNIDIFTSLYKELNTNYKDELNPGELIHEGIDAMLKTLDPYTEFIPEAEVEDYKFITTGQYGGIGAIIHKQDDLIYIDEPYENMPAHIAGLKAGDIVLAVNGESAKGKSTSDLGKILKGQAGTSITLTIQRADEAPIDVEIERANVKIDNIPYAGIIDNDIAYIKLSNFTKDAGKEVKDAFINLKKETELSGVIIDLRGNGGGLLNEAVRIANLFVEKGKLIVTTKGKAKDKNNSYYTVSSPIDSDIPLTILVDNSSASASEILAGAIQDLDRGVVIGQKTYGKGLVQNIIPLSYNAQVKMTVAEYYIPSGRCIQAIDYTHSENNSNASRIPDSLVTEFKTVHGRSVFDSGGIDPDIVTKKTEFDDLSIDLINTFMIFNYATNFYREHDSIEPASEFNVTEDIYQDFVTFTQNEDFKYESSLEVFLEKFKEIAVEEEQFEKINNEYEVLLAQVNSLKENEFITYESTISKLLRLEIVGRYYFQKGQVISELIDDTEVEKAIEVLRNQSTYLSILKTDNNNN